MTTNPNPNAQPGEGPYRAVEHPNHGDFIEGPGGKRWLARSPFDAQEGARWANIAHAAALSARAGEDKSKTILVERVVEVLQAAEQPLSVEEIATRGGMLVGSVRMVMYSGHRDRFVKHMASPRKIRWSLADAPQPHPAPGDEAVRLLGDLLAVIHGDGGHRQAEVGTEQAVREAKDKWYALAALGGEGTK